jgi:hypothetical protein
MTVLVFKVGYTDVPRTPRGRLEHEIERLQCLLWADPADVDLQARIAELEAELHALDRGGAS